LAAKSVAAMKAELAEEKVTRAKVQAKTETVARKVEDLKKMADRFATQISSLEEKVEHLDNKVIDVFTEATLRR
jgi:septal ring factor EnvC (AmiA/AmiB activator)